VVKQKVCAGVYKQMVSISDAQYTHVEINLRTQDAHGVKHSTVITCQTQYMDQAAEDWAQSLGASYVTFEKVRGFNK
jgi:hypothetical protein